MLGFLLQVHENYLCLRYIADCLGVILNVDPTRPPPRPGKTVRIASPPTERIPISPMSEDEVESSVFNTLHAVAHSNHRGSPPPLSRGDTTSSSDDEGEEEEGADPFNSNNPDSSGSENEDAVRNTLREHRRSSWSLTVDPAGLGSGNDKKPEDPVPGKISRPMSFAGESQASLAKGGGGGNGGVGREGLDVDSFKRLLLTGDAGAGKGQGTATGRRSSATPDSGEDMAETTTTPPSRNPALDPGSSLPGAQEGPTLPKNGSPTNSGNRERKKPPPPKTRHGKLIKSDEPQTSPSQRPTPQRSSSSLSKSYDPPRQGSGSFPDTDKSIPTVPADSSFTSITDTHVVQSPPDIPSPVPPQIKKPPTPPLARRQSQLRPSKNTLSRSNSARLAQSSTGGGSPTPTRAVPPLPPRRQDWTSITPHSDTSSTQRAPLPATSGNEHGSEESSSQQSPSRPPSISSRKQHNRPPQSQPPPPPPPRRLRGSSRSSADSANPAFNPAGEVAKGNEEGEAGSKPDTSNANDILADLSKLQREVDELRGQYKG